MAFMERLLNIWIRTNEKLELQDSSIFIALTPAADFKIGHRYYASS